MSVTVSQQKNFVGGEWVDAVEGGTMEVLNPATGETIAEVPSGTQADVDRAVEAAKKALPEWLESARGRERPDRQAVRADAADDAPLRAAGRRDPAARRPQRDHRRRGAGRRGAGAPPRRPHGLAHGRRRYRQRDRPHRRGHAEARAP